MNLPPPAGRRMRKYYLNIYVFNFKFKIIYVPDHWKDHRLHDIEDSICENLGCQINTHVLNFGAKNRDSKILGGKNTCPPPPRKNILTASIFGKK